MRLKANFSTKSLQINKNQSRILMAVAGATIVSVFCLTSAKVLLNQAMYQRRVINARNASTKQIEANIKSANQLSTQYKDVFLGNNSENIIGGSVAGSRPGDGDNGDIVLEALPTSYDFPALLTSMSNLLASDGVGSPSIGGADQAITFDSTPTNDPKPVKIDLTVSGNTSYANTKKLIQDMEKSIRPIDVTKLTLSGSESNLALSVNFTTYYQQAKTINIPSKEIK
jgi:hypothetical protein